ncbi:DUF6704 family protein [Candidatus Aquiluna sp. UB-MaderosW2red]|jgi:hypothetical protein|uniref:DUF6704 family protein n=1 Tax=Candidatus Aquiluna sp. UB-MaderosW2red TaxID=1855377 RepID=UPI000875EC09|nr:DUF6704 family protein [Candidatus Aquiluna sp. UB-MaderosW2red]SCX11790.1 hypothetical protein SAMN05216534_1206 [Candidatus Aquiluna sp. UB-MaderosW2red]
MTYKGADPGHGNSIAAWVTVTIILFAFCVGTLFFYLDIPEVVWASAAVAALGPVVGIVLRTRGYGVSGQKNKNH